MRLSHSFATAVLALAIVLAGCDAGSGLAGPDASGPSTPVATTGPVAGTPIPNQYIVVLNDDVADAPREAQRIVDGRGLVRYSYQHVLKGFAFHGTAEEAAALELDPDVVSVTPDAVVTKVTTQTNATWGLDRSDARGGLDNSYTYNATGAGVTAYILDTGIRTSHSDFGGRASVGFDAINDGQNGQDCDGHGTHVAGTVGGATWGIAKDVNLVAVRVLDCNGSGSYSGVLAGVDWVAANAQLPAVANMSLGGGAYSPLDAAVNNAVAAGVPFAVSAGNSNANACNYSPARATDAITVGSTTSSDARSSFSNYGACVDIFGPGSSITSAWYTSNTASATLSGTSMSSPHVAGGAALYLETNPTASSADVASALFAAATPNAVSNALSANDRLLYTLDFGAGNPPPPPPGNTPPSAAFSVSTSDLAATFTDGSSDSDGSVVAWSWDFGDGGTSSAQNPSHTYGAAGTYTVSLTVTDDDGATASTSQSVTVTAPPTGTPIALTAEYRTGRRPKVRLDWTPADGGRVNVYRNGTLIKRTRDDGRWNDKDGSPGDVYRVCETDSSDCSNDATAQ